VIGPSQRPVPDKAQHPQEKNIHVSGGIRTLNPSSERPKIYNLDRAANVIGLCFL
jgi:hypothetical protein